VLEPDQGTRPASGVSVHQIDPFETLEVARLLYPEKLPERVLLVLVETDNIDERGLEQACREVVEIVDREIGDGPRIAEAGSG